MGNTQSNTRTTNYKIFRIVSRDDNQNYIRCYLDDYVTYSNGNYKHMDFDYETTRFVLEGLFLSPPTPLEQFTGSARPEHSPLSVGDYVRIDLNSTREQSSGHNFSRYGVQTVGREITDSEGNISGILTTTRELGEEIIEARQRYVAIAESTRFQNQVLQSQTSYNLPPR